MAVRNPAATVVGSLLLIGFGLLAIYRLPIQLLPELTPPRISLYTSWRAAAPEEIEEQIIQPQERVLRNIDGGTIAAARHEAVADARFWGLDHLPGGQDISYAYGMSYSGGMVAGESFSSISSVHGEGVAWVRASPDTWLPVGIGLPTYDSLNSPAAGASGNAQWLVGRVSFTTPTAPDVDTDAYRWSETDGFELLGLPAGFKLAAATGANAAGNVIAGYGGPYVGYVDGLAALDR